MDKQIFSDLIETYYRQTEVFYGRRIDLSKFSQITNESCEKYLRCLSKKKLKHRPLSIINHADEYTSFLLFLSRTAYLYDCIEVAESSYLINKRMNSFDCFYTREIPEIFHLEHPFGSIIGQANLKNYLVIYQGVSIGGDLKLRYPEIGEGVALFANSTLLSDSKIGDNCAIGAGVQLYSEAIKPDTSVSLRNQAGIVQTQMTWSVKERYFHYE